MGQRCIFHYPNPIDFNAEVGSGVRPLNMYRALKASGYIVDDVSGYGSERKEKIKRIKRNIKNGIKYDFIYSESLTMPTLLSEKNHLPRYPFLDFSFFRFCKKHGIKIGLFYRDIFWKFPLYREGVRKWIPYITIPFYKYDQWQYKRLLDVLYVPTEQFMRYVDYDFNWRGLPSGGCDRSDSSIYDNEGIADKISLFYIGGIILLNDISGLLNAVKDHPNVELTVCCPKDTWENNKYLFEGKVSKNVNVVHSYGDELRKYYEKTHVACVYFENNEYRDMGMPVKLFEYIGYGKPVISNSRTPVADFIEKYDIGWVVDYETEQFRDLLTYLSNNRNEITEKAINVRAIISDNTWDARIKQVITDLT